MARECGLCTACCTHLGIDELKKYPGVTCNHLSKDITSTKRCGVYANRPAACSRFQCAWLEGLGTETMRPDRCGLLVVPYQLESGGLTATITIIDERRCGTIEHGPLYLIVQSLLSIGFAQIKIINNKTKGVIYFADGKIYKGDLLPQRSFEDLQFAAYDPPLGTYHQLKK